MEIKEEVHRNAEAHIDVQDCKVHTIQTYLERVVRSTGATEFIDLRDMLAHSQSTIKTRLIIPDGFFQSIDMLRRRQICLIDDDAIR